MGLLWCLLTMPDIPFVEEANSESLSPEQLEVRANDVSVLIDAALSGDLFEQHRR